MVKINDRVYPVFNMNQVGTVVDVNFRQTDMHLIGGTAQTRMYAIIKLDKDGTLIEVPADETMRCE
jgi:NADH:ubiquinone oxidoreductase subunit B-like Fe-S oxidoreductase